MSDAEKLESVVKFAGAICLACAKATGWTE